MPTPAPRASIESFFEFNEYCAAALGADPDARDLEPLLAAANDKLTRAVSARTAAQRAVNRCAALRDFNFRGLMAAVEALERKASAAFDAGEAAPGYQRLFVQTPAQMGRSSLESRADLFGRFLAEAQSAETPASLHRPVKAVALAWSGYQTAARNLGAAHSALAKARDKEEAAKVDNITTLRKLEGRLTDRMPADPKRVRGYFPPTKAAKRAAATGAAGSSPQNGASAAG